MQDERTRLIYKFFFLKRTIKEHKTDNKKQPVWAVINKKGSH